VVSSLEFHRPCLRILFDVILTSYNIIADVTQGAELYKAERINAAPNALNDTNDPNEPNKPNRSNRSNRPNRPEGELFNIVNYVAHYAFMYTLSASNITAFFIWLSMGDFFGD